MRKRLAWGIPILLTMAGLGLQARSPYLIAWRPYLPWIFPILGTGAAWGFRRTRALAILLLLVSWIPMGLQWRFSSQRREVLSANPAMLQRLGRHFIVGYRDFAEAERLVSHGAVGGIFVTQRNIQGKSRQQVQGEIRRLQELQAANGLPPLYIATDQEGGPVSRLSPLVPVLPSLAEWKRENPIPAYAELQAEPLAELGVNLNFSPVVDLKNPKLSDWLQPHTPLGTRAISEDPEEVAAVAGQYCRVFEGHGLRCTLKHFPGLSKVAADTHLREGVLNDTPDRLEHRDWLPFRKVLDTTHAFLMLGHVRVPSLDPEFPASISRRIVTGLIRREWGHEGILVTDDFTMGPIAGRRGGVGLAAVQAIHAGVDLILISYDGDLYYEAMEKLLDAAQHDRLDWTALARSEVRLRKDLNRSAVWNQFPNFLDLLGWLGRALDHWVRSCSNCARRSCSFPRGSCLRLAPDFDTLK